VSKNKDSMWQNEEMSIEESVEAVSKQTKKRLDIAMLLGELLSNQKKHKYYVSRGYKSFKEFIENEYNVPGGYANKLISNYNLYVETMDMDEVRFKTIGIDKLDLIKPFVKNAKIVEQELWLEKAEEMPISQLREEITELREQQRKANQTIKDVMIQQWLEKMVTFFNCGRRELNFKLALYFQEKDLDQIRDEIREQQRKFEDDQIKAALEQVDE
jgi:hypothetical protein